MIEFFITFYHALIAGLAAIAASGFAPWLTAAFAATAVTFFITARDRTQIDQALAAASIGKEPLEIFDLSRGDAAGMMERKVVVPPERLWTYDEHYVESFALTARSVIVRHHTALDLYLKSTLFWDVLFAASLALFVALFWAAVAFADWAPVSLARVALLCGAMGIVYGAADIAEDIKLGTMLRHTKVDAAEAAAANVLTRIKMVTIALSIVGWLVFAGLHVVNRAWLELEETVEAVIAAVLRRLHPAPAAGTDSR
jgi:hypothetical protein